MILRSCSCVKLFPVDISHSEEPVVLMVAAEGHVIIHRLPCFIISVCFYGSYYVLVFYRGDQHQQAAGDQPLSGNVPYLHANVH